LPQPTQVNGITQKPIEGVSMIYSFADGEAPDQHTTQYFEIFGNRGIYHAGWSAITKHRTPWQTTGDVGIAFDDDVWELYDGSTDWTQARNLATEQPAKLAELQRLFLIEATRYNVLPLDDRSFERVLPEISGKPALIGGQAQLLLPGMGALTEQHVLNWRNRSWALSAQVEIPDAGASGVLLSLGGHTGGWSYYLKDGRAVFTYNLFGLEETIVRAEAVVPPGAHRVRMEFAYDGGGLGKGGTVTHYLDGQAVGSGRVARTEPIGFGYEYTDVGRDAQSPVTADYPPGTNAFSGTLKFIELESGTDSHDHVVDPAQFLHFMIAKQ
jgi:arylsulfatase